MGLFIPGVYLYPVIKFVDYLGIYEKMCNLLKEQQIYTCTCEY